MKKGIKLIYKAPLIKIGLSHCSTCHITKPIIEFTKDRSSIHGIAGSCKLCQRKTALKHNHNITQEEYERLLKQQYGVCAICKGPQQRKGINFSVDHDHKTNVIRGLLCDNCNRGIGFLQDNIPNLHTTINYLTKSRYDISKWDSRFLHMAELIKTFSRDPSTKVGCVIAKQKQFISMGFNGFPSGVADTEERYNNRELKYKMVVHAEENALIFAKQSLIDCTIYTVPFPSCARCSVSLIQAGARRFVSYKIIDPELQQRWQQDLEIANQLYDDVGAELVLLNNEI